MFKNLCWVITSVVLAGAMAARAQGTNGDDQPGLILTIESLQPSSHPPAFPDSRVSRLAALYVPAGAPPSSFAPPGRFRATFRGDLNLRLRSYMKFSIEGRGKLTLSLNGAKVLEVSGDDWSKTTSTEIRLNKGKNALVAVYESPEAGDAAMRLFWSSKSFPPEPVPPMVFSHSQEAELAKSLQIREGRSLLSGFRCLKCHAGGQFDSDEMKKTIPELAIDAPSLTQIGIRLNRDWLAAWISDPHSLRRTARMPKLFSDTDNSHVRDIVTYLASLGTPSPGEASGGDVSNGGRIFANLDCIACHTTPDSKDDPTRVSLKYVNAKFKPEALRQYLLNPEEHYAWNPMPNFHLSQAEAADLTAYLLSIPGAKLVESAPGDASKGSELVRSSGCLNCHELGTEKSTAHAPPLEALTAGALAKGCLATSPANRGAAPDFALTAQQCDAMAAFVATDHNSLARLCAPEFAERQIVAMRCAACHARDGNESLLAQSLDAESQALHQKYPNPAPAPGELFAAEQRPPMLTWAGEKLRPQWMQQFIGGKIDYKLRYFLRARMPSFAARAPLLAAGIAEEHGCPPTLPPNPKSDAALAEEGRKLCGKTPNVGLSCVQCHAVADTPPFAAFEAPSINLEYSAERLRHDYFMRWMHDPLRIDAATKMPRFDDAEGKTPLAAFGGDARAQFEAIWQYLLEGRQINPPP